MYEKILIGYDDSEYSRAAVKEVAAWLKRHGGKAELVHGVYSDEEEFCSKPEILGQRINDGKDACAKAGQIAADAGVTMEIKVKEGDPPQVICSTAQEQAADLIALGTHGRRGISRMIMGSVTAKVIAESPCDVLVVKKPCGTCSGKYEKILVPFDSSPSSKKALETACKLAKLDQSEITVFYVIPRYEEMINFVKTESIQKALNQEAEKILDQARETAAALGVTVKSEIGNGSPSENIVATSAKEGTDLIIMGSYGWRGINKSIIGSTAERVIMSADMPVLVTR